jgi:hypothetical protein
MIRVRRKCAGMSNKKEPVPVVAASPPYLPYVQVRMKEEQLVRLKQLALDERTSVANLLREGIDLMLKKRKLPPL